MNLVSRVLAVLLIVVCIGSGIIDFLKPEKLVEGMSKLRIPTNALPVLGAIKIAAAIGLIVGFGNIRLAEVTGICLCAYFAIATTTHTRIKDSIRNTAPAFFLLVLSMLFVLTTLAR
jgi:putative oxidoreductase